MTTSERTAEHQTQGLQGDKNVHCLPPGSYTAQRLKHASARHLHLTTRRIFIGPIPEAWIAGNRKSWAKYRPRMLSYSSKTATFNAADNVSDFQTLTGLGTPAGKQSQGVSFPQPADAHDEEAEEDPIENDGNRRVQPAAGPEIHVNSNETSDRQLSPQDSTRGSPGRAKNLTAASKHKDAQTFVTAKETLEADFDEQTNKPSSTSGSVEPESPQTIRSGTRSPTPLRMIESTESTQALLSPKEQAARRASENGESSKITHDTKSTLKPLNTTRSNSSLSQRRRSSTQPQVLLEVDPEAYDEGDDSPADLVHTERVNTGMVRFELPEEIAAKGSKIRGQVTEAKERVTTKDFRKGKAEPGQLLKAERMLVRIDITKHELDGGYSEKDSAKSETVLIEKWREYMVTCRKSSSEEGGFVLHMAKTRVLPMLANERTSRKIAHEVKLKPGETRANLFSALDKTIVIWEPKRKGTRIYILRPRSSASSVEWYTFLNLTLGWKTPDSLTISVPDLGVNLEVDNPLNEHRVLEAATKYNEASSHKDKQAIVTDGQVTKQIIDHALRILQNSDFHHVLKTWEQRDERLGLAWRQYDRLEWIHGASEERMYGALAMHKTHELEIRNKIHYPTSVTTGQAEDGSPVQLEEPFPVEGFLVRQTSQTGRDSLMGKNFFKKLYFSTHDHLLCFSEPSKAVPPKPPSLIKALEEGSTKVKELAAKIPLIYQVDPYPLDDDGRISWLSNSNLVKRREHDQHAYEESERSVHLMLETEGYINMCHITKVRKYKVKKDGALETAHEDSDSNDEATDEHHNQHHDVDRSFVLLLDNGLTIRLQAYDKVARKEWVQRLRQLIRYWKLRTTGDIDLYKEVRQQNLDNLGIDEEMESVVGVTAEKWEVSKSIASPELFHLCGISCCRPITMSGTVYRKPRLHSAFKRCVVVLCHGKLLIFQATLRTSSGRERPHILHKREEVVDLKESYIYSGSLTEDDLLYQNKTFDSNHPGHNALPRVFRDDAWTSMDEESTTCFVVWHGRRKSFFKASPTSDNTGLLSSVRYVSSLGVPGRSMVFKTRSRAERDHWVTNISMEIERLQQTEDVRIIVSK